MNTKHTNLITKYNKTKAKTSFVWSATRDEMMSKEEDFLNKFFEKFGEKKIYYKSVDGLK